MQECLCMCAEGCLPEHANVIDRRKQVSHSGCEVYMYILYRKEMCEVCRASNDGRALKNSRLVSGVGALDGSITSAEKSGAESKSSLDPSLRLILDSLRWRRTGTRSAWHLILHFLKQRRSTRYHSYHHVRIRPTVRHGSVFKRTERRRRGPQLAFHMGDFLCLGGVDRVRRRRLVQRRGSSEG